MTASGIKNKTPTDGTRQGVMKVNSPDVNSLERNVNSLSIIIPTLNEAQTIGGLLDQLRMQAGINLDIILVDGGSTDATLSIAESQVASGQQVRLMQTEPGRGRQMNAGAEMAKHDWLLFLHCDSILTCPVQLRDALGSLKAASDQGQAVAGHFPLAFDARDPELKRRLGFFEAKTRLNRPGTFNGDQGLMISRGHFRQAGCFPCDLPFLEDQAFAVNFRSIGSFITLPFTLGTSARRFEEEGFTRRVLLNAVIMGMFHLNSKAFFARAKDVYPAPAATTTETTATTKQKPQGTAAFLSLALASIFDKGLRSGLANIYRLGRYATVNGWQLFLFMGGEKALRHWDRLARPLLCNPLGYLIVSLSISVWLPVIWLKSD